jgi:hypothetical protein
MKIWCKILIVIFSLVATLSIAGDMSTESNSVVQSQKVSVLPLEELTAIYVIKTGEQTKHSVDSQVKPDNASQIELASNSERPLIQVSAAACTFGCLKQNSPDYHFKIILPLPVVNNFKSLVYDTIELITPWFILHNRSTGSRISGWKDSNQLYATLIIDHI